MSKSIVSLFGVDAPTNEVQATLTAATSTAAVDALADSSIADGDRRLVVFAVAGAAARIRFGASGVAAASATTGIPLADGEKVALWMRKGGNSFYRAISAGTPQLTVFVVT